MTHIVIDIETGRAPRKDIDQRIADITFTKEAQKKGKTAIEHERQEKITKIEDHSFLEDTSPITCIGMMIDSQVTILTTIHTESIEHIPVQVFGLEAEMLLAFKVIMESFDTEEIMLITFNGKVFDLPRIRCRMGFYGLKIPRHLSKYGTEHFDVKKEFGEHFGMKNWITYSLDGVSKLLGLEGKNLKWEEAQAFLDAGNYKEYILYNVLDLTLTYQCYQRMT